ncbi:acyl-CoA thioesterase [Uliginosibacterium sp. 31-16]|uniref:acyl-CoA thioesterase n=1 Tax=Uliginosibacterium sp. 31-16 TaxID=3068315 RepID=UPI00273D920F|nr:acyl-CoA thioesterase [Uliginosibacterium sp. 31-16]MDP5238637.1 acyl-CoA thioesterase [Uliginosibacterium sp. 31-16]
MTRIFSQRFAVPAEAIDVHRHVNNVAYLQWMQDVAIAHTTDLGWPMERYFEKRCSWVIRSHFIEYLRPALLDDPLNLVTWVADMGERSSTRKYLFWRESDRQVIARAETAWVFIDIRAGLPRPILAEVRSAFAIVEDEAEVMALLEAS